MAWTLSAFADEAGETLDEQLAALAEAGIDHIDPRNLDGYNIVELPPGVAERVRKRLDDAGVAVGMYGSPIGKIDIADDFKIDEKRMAHLATLRPILGSQAVRMFSYFNRARASLEHWRTEAIDRVKRLAELAEEHDLILYHEHEPGLFGGSHQTVMALYEAVGTVTKDRFRLIFDFDNYVQAGENTWDNYQKQRAAVYAIHLKESKWQPDETYMHVPVGQGDGQVERILRDLASRGWDGQLTLEPHLARSTAVLKTGPHGRANQSLATLSPHECFVVAAKAASDLIRCVTTV